MMYLLINVLLADAPLSDPSTLNRSTTEAAKNDPLIAVGGQHTVLWGAVLLAIAIVAIIRIFSPRAEHAIIAAIILSLGLIGLFLGLGR